MIIIFIYWYIYSFRTVTEYQELFTKYQVLSWSKYFVFIAITLIVRRLYILYTVSKGLHKVVHLCSLSLKQGATYWAVLQCISCLGILMSAPFYQDIADGCPWRCRLQLAIYLYYWQSSFIIIKFVSRAEAKLPGAARLLCYVLPCVECSLVLRQLCSKF